MIAKLLAIKKSLKINQKGREKKERKERKKEKKYNEVFST